MPTPCNLFVAGYPGSCEKEGTDRVDTSDVFEIEHHLHQPVDNTTGAATGVRVHSPMRVVTVVDKATPGMHKALCTGENIAQVELRFFRIDPATRSEAMYYKITLDQARVVDVSPYMPMSFIPQNESYRHMVQLSFVYEQITWNWLPDTVVELDRWRAPGAA